MAADLDARVAGYVQLHVDLEDEIGVVLFGAKERVGAGAYSADDAAVVDAIGGSAACLAPSDERLAVEERHESAIIARAAISCRYRLFFNGPITLATAGSTASAQVL